MVTGIKQLSIKRYILVLIGILKRASVFRSCPINFNYIH